MQSLKLLLDTHTLLWAIGETGKLSERAIQEIKNPDNEILVSAVSLWEIALKYTIGKLAVDFDIKDIPEYCQRMNFELIPLEPADALNSLQLPKKENQPTPAAERTGCGCFGKVFVSGYFVPFAYNHKDPFDRMLIYQCIKKEYTLISGDAKIRSYKENGLKYIW